MSTPQQKQTPCPYVLGPASPQLVFFLKVTPYPKTDGDYAPSVSYPIGSGYPLPYDQHGMPYGAPNIPSKNDSFNALDKCWFSNKTIRNMFISKVYFIIMCQLLVTTIFKGLETFHQSTKMLMRKNMSLFILGIVITFGVIIAFAHVKNLRRKSPENVILLFIFTVAGSITVAIGTIPYSPDKCIMGFSVATLLCFALSIFALLSTTDLTIKVGCALIAAITVMLIFSVATFFPSKLITVIIGSVGAAIFSIYPIYDMQLKVEGEHKYSIASEGIVFAVITIYLDIINMFMYILTILGSSRHN